MEPGLSRPGGKGYNLASSARLSAQGLAFNVVAQPILNDKNFNNGKYYDDEFPAQLP